jgi:probable phosphoglycerate mutase
MPTIDHSASPVPTLYLCRHGDTAWSPSRRLAGRTDLPLTEEGELSARRLGERLRGVPFDRVLTSPLLRARRTAELAGFGDRATIDPRLIEMDFGRYDGRTTADICLDVPGWTYLANGCPGGETADDLGERADAFLSDLSDASATVLLFAHSVILRVLTARYLRLPPTAGRHFMLSPASVSILGYDSVEAAPAIALWNDQSHLGAGRALA